MNFHFALLPPAEWTNAQPPPAGDPEYQPSEPALPRFPDPTQPEPQGPTDPELPLLDPPPYPEWPIPRALELRRPAIMHGHRRNNE